MKIFLIILISIINLNASNFIGNNGEPNNSLVFESNEIYENNIENKLKTQDRMFEELDIANLIREIDNYNILIKNKDLDLKKQIGAIYTDKKIISEHLDLDDIRNQIETMKNSIIDIKSDVKKELENIKYKGIFLAVHKFENTYEKKEILSKISENHITPKAIEDLNGIFINSYTEIKNHITVLDIIVGISKGKVSIEESYIKETYHKDKLYIYLAKVIVSPLNEELNEVKISKNNFNGQIFNLEKDDNWEKIIIGMGVKPEVILKVKNIMRNKLEVVKTENLTEIRREEEIISAGINRVTKINKDIQVLKKKILKKEKEINKIAKKYEIEINNFKISNIKNIIKKIENQIDYFTEFRYKVKEKELIQQTTTLTAEGDPKSEIAKKVTALKEQIAQTYEKKDLQFKKDEVENYMQKSSTSKGIIKIFRKIDNLWLYIVPKDDADRFSVTVVTNFIIDIKNDHLITDDEVNTSIISLGDNFIKNNSLDGKEYKRYTERIVTDNENKISNTNEIGDPFPIVTEKKIISVQNTKTYTKKAYYFVKNNLIFIIPLFIILFIYDNFIRNRKKYSNLRVIIVGSSTIVYALILFTISVIPIFYKQFDTTINSIYYWTDLFFFFLSILFFNEFRKMLNKKHSYFKANKYINIFIYSIIISTSLLIYLGLNEPIFTSALPLEKEKVISDILSEITLNDLFNLIQQIDISSIFKEIFNLKIKTVLENKDFFLFIGVILSIVVGCILYLIINILYAFSIRKLYKQGFIIFKIYSNMIFLFLLTMIIVVPVIILNMGEDIILEVALGTINSIEFIFLALAFFYSLKAEKKYEELAIKCNETIDTTSQEKNALNKEIDEEKKDF